MSDLIGFEVLNPVYPQIPITLKMLLSHRSSLNDSRGYFALDSVNPSKTQNAAQCYNKYQPGSRYQYCNLNFNMVGTIIERVSGERFDQYVKRHILDPLELHGGYCIDSLDKKLFATLYEYDMSKESFTAAPDAYNPRREQIGDYIMGYSTPVFSPTGGMKISAGDLARYMMMHMNGGKGNGKRIIPEKYAKLMRQPLSEEEGYGLALTNVSDLIKGVHLTGHTGSAYGLYSAMFFNPKEKFGFVVITNGCKPGQTKGITNLLADCVNLLYQEFVAR
ncbi:beta-lactamase family protein [Niabella hibiscisoli]|nr:serine hydrolase [Niabella hibiscisoli]MCH5721172.1 beta-lactamase family protein [Niabella hibiscisoli]